MFSVCRQNRSGNQGYIFSLHTDISPASQSVKSHNELFDDNTYWLQIVPDNALIGDDIDYSPFPHKMEKIIDHYASPGKGSPCKAGHAAKGAFTVPKVGSLVGPHKFTAPSYSEIKNEMEIRDPADYEIPINAEITPGMDVLLNGILIASAPEYKQQKTGKTKKLTQPERARFCRGVIWWLINDAECLKDKLVEIGYTTQAKIETPDPVDYLIENITLSPFPGPACLDIIPYDQYVVDTLTKELIEEGPESPYEITGSYLDADNNPETADQIINAFCIIPTGRYYPHLKVYIQEIPA
jgi:hypothetical protein